jgi:hypothetical protein
MVLTVLLLAFTSSVLLLIYGLFLWLVLIIVVYLLSYINFKLRYRELLSVLGELGWNYRMVLFWRQLYKELMPSIFSTPLLLESVEVTYCQVILSFLAQMGALALLIYATVILSSQIFIPYRDAVIVMTRFLAGSFACRIVLEFELFGIR